MWGIGYFQFRNFLRIFLGFFLEDFFGGIFLEDHFWRNVFEGISLRIFLEDFFGRIFLGGFF